MKANIFSLRDQHTSELGESNEILQQKIQALAEKFLNVIQLGSQVMLDKEKEIEVLLFGILARGHLLIEDVPGVGKTTLAQTVSKLLGFKYSRIQFTNDLLPSDITGGMIFNSAEQRFQFRKGPLFSEFVLGDELNRANPKTQSALLEALEENQISVDGQLFPLPEHFTFVATQNPRSQVGTFALPESQIDRFLIGLEIHYASKEAETKIFMGYDSRRKLKDVEACVTMAEVSEAQEIIPQIKISPKLAEYVYALISETRKHDYTSLSTRSGIALIKAAQAYAFLQKRAYVTPEDVKEVAPYVLGHRLGGNDGLKVGQARALELIHKIRV